MILLAPELAKDAAELATGVGGIAGSIIGVLMGVVGILAGVIVIMQRRADKIYGYRLAERDTLKDALHEAAQAINAQANAAKERNKLLEDLAETISAQTIASTLLVERLTLQHDHLSADSDKTGTVITSVADAMRNVALQSSGIQQKIDQLLLGVPGISKEIKELFEKLLREVQDAARHRSR